MSAKSESQLFYIGRKVDQATGQAGADNVLYDPADLTTHGFVTGMTGSGKTGLCISILEETALNSIPAIIIDPKGDLTNLVLHFPNQSAQDFEPWIDPEAARREGQTVAEMAEATAQIWQKGLASAGLGKAEILALQEKVDYAIYTPGSNAGIPVNILSSFAAPNLPWEENSEILREKISSTVTALLGLVGMQDIDPLRSREHILLSNLVENVWNVGRSLDLNELIMQVQKPPFERLGAFPLDNFFPEKERFNLAILLNNFLASPSFQVWQEGQSMDIASILYSPDGKARHSIFYLSHLNDSERMFFVTLLFAAIESWMRSQRGTSGLRALVYFDEIMGYLPPIQNPPSRGIMLRMLKQARAFGIGLLLATQNPVDMDYKALSNAGTWIIGRLQTEQDRNRLLEGLISADSNIDRDNVNEMFNKLAKRVFLLHNIHDKAGLQLFQTRFALNYLAGPMTRAQIPALNQLVGISKNDIKAKQESNAPVKTPEQKPIAITTPYQPLSGISEFTATPPALPAGIAEYYLPNELSVKEALNAAKITVRGVPDAESIIYRPALLAQAEARYLNRRYNLDFANQFTALVDQKPNGLLRWENYSRPTIDASALLSQPLPQAKFAVLPGWLADSRQIKDLNKDFQEWVYRNGNAKVRANEALKVYASPELSDADFRQQCIGAAREAMKAEQVKLEAAYIKKKADLEKKIDRQQSEVSEQKSELDSRRLDEIASGGEMLLSLFGGRKKSLSRSISKRRMAAKAKSDYEQEVQDLDKLQGDYADLEKEYQDALQDLQNTWTEKTKDVTEVSLTPALKDIHIDLFGVAWRPYYLVKVGDIIKEIPAFKST